MNAPLLQSDSLAGQVRSLLAAVDQLQAEVGELRRENAELRRENAELRQQVSELRCEVGYWKSRHADAVQRNIKLQAELDQAKAEIRQLKAERFGKQSEKQSTSDRSNQLDGPQATKTAKNKRGQQPGRPAPKRRDHTHLPVREETVDVPDDAKVCGCCGKPMADLGYCDDGEQIEMETIIYQRVIRRKRYRRMCDCRQQPRTVTAPLPAKLLPKSLYGTSIWVHLLLEKFHLQRPTQRTIEQLRLLGLSLAPGTIADGLRRIEPLMTPIYEAIRSYHLQSDYFHADDPRIPLDNNYGERLIRNPAVGRKNYYGSGAEWAGRLAMMMFSIFATLVLWQINPRTWLQWYLDACAEQGGQPADNPASFLPWNLSEARLAELQNVKFVEVPNTS